MPSPATSQGTFGAHFRMKESEVFSISSFHLRNSQHGEVPWPRRQWVTKPGGQAPAPPVYSSQPITTTQTRGLYHLLLFLRLPIISMLVVGENDWASGIYWYDPRVRNGSRDQRRFDFS